jgi:autotransporter-associated beta strand protein
VGTGTQFGAWVARVGVCSTALLLVLALHPARAQSTWNGGTTDYNTAGNWTPAAVPATAGQSAIFDATGSTTVNVSSPVAPDSWTFTTNSQSYTFTGSAVNFSLAGASGGVIDNAGSGQNITINNVIGGSGVQVRQLGNNTLILTAANTYTGGTTIAVGGIQVQHNSALGTGSVTLDGGALQAGVNGLIIANNIGVTTNAGLIDNQGFTLTLTGHITDSAGPGHVEFEDTTFSSGTTILANTNTYTGGTGRQPRGRAWSGTLKSTACSTSSTPTPRASRQSQTWGA